MADRTGAVEVALLTVWLGVVCASGYRVYAERDALYSFTHPPHLRTACDDLRSHRLNWSVDYGHLVCEPWEALK